jgi:hypothetical protein
MLNLTRIGGTGGSEKKSAERGLFAAEETTPNTSPKRDYRVPQAVEIGR